MPGWPRPTPPPNEPMNQGPLFFFGVLATLSASWYGLVIAPRMQLGNLIPHATTNDTGVVIYQPVERDGAARQGADVYRGLGCVECHTQQVRTAAEGSDLARGFGQRRSVARDYIFEGTVQLGASRIGPDLANYGERLGTNQFPWARLYQPRLLTNNVATLCPGAPYLFERRDQRDDIIAPDAIALPGIHDSKAAQRVVPTLRARQLAAYLGSLRQSVELPEAALPKREEAL